MEQITKKKKKEYDYDAVAEKLNSMIEDLEKTEKETVLEIWKEYQKAPEIGAFFEKLIKSQSWCYDKFAKYNLQLKKPQMSQSEAIQKAHAEKKVEQLITVIEEDETIVPEEKQEFVEELKSEPAIKVVQSDDFRLYETAMSKISKIYNITSSEFDVTHNYKMKLIDELKRAIKHLEDVLNDVEGEYEST